MTAGFQRALEELYGLERRKNKLGLEGTLALLAALGNPHLRFRSVHVAGTNGKGSTAALIERVLREQGIRTGLFTSPHLVDFRERMRVNGRWVDQDWLETMLARIQDLPEAQDRTFFEVVTALGFAWFAEQKVEIAVVEVGLGGRLDTTNVITPEVSVITSIGFDHMEILGDTIEAIAAEKAGIVKPGVPVVENVVQTSARETIRRIAEERGAPAIQVSERVSVRPTNQPNEVECMTRTWGALRIDTRGAGPLQHLNFGTAAAALEMLSERGVRIDARAVATGLASARWPGRLEHCPHEPRLWWDGAHNPQGVHALYRVWHLTRRERPAALVLALSGDKKTDEMLSMLDLLSPGAKLIATRSRNERAMPPEEIAAIAREGRPGDPESEWEGGWDAEVAPDVPAACRRALEFADAQHPVLLTGSLFAVGEAMEAFGGAPGEML